ncbi:hypothetical protein RclHR1_10710005 [Rhizophagus clarus]|uniref:3CxxC-type domain-containing protein n=1 Tax=Rhizophagus clarus TaxID=94130 RepID=A0A2Z6QV49_9GLOM|nr:hypothetical protein RclHR1_10710005 [Rhizophagus clarus]GES74415.1 hypothetical protein GLOIN_2v1879451 [Rhizophagus clarus]
MSEENNFSYNSKEVTVKWGKSWDEKRNENTEKELSLQIPIIRIHNRIEEREEQQQIIDIIRHLIENNYYIVYGHWSCEMKHEWQIQYTNILETFRKYLKIPRIIYSFFWKRCEECNKTNGTGKMNLISSFRLPCPSNNSNKDSTVEIIRHLEWNNHYRVFGNWKCLNCQNRWRSAYTWISLKKFVEKKHLVQGDFYMQECKKCKLNYNDSCIISNYKPLELSESEKPHIRDLCAKCQHGATCRHQSEFRSEYFSI